MPRGGVCGAMLPLRTELRWFSRRHALHPEKATQIALFKRDEETHVPLELLYSLLLPASRPGGAFLGGKEARSTPILHRRPLGLLLPRQSELLSRPQDPPRDGGTRVSLKARLTSPSSGVSSGGACGAIKDQYARNPSRCGRGSRSPGKTKPGRYPPLSNLRFSQHWCCKVGGCGLGRSGAGARNRPSFTASQRRRRLLACASAGARLRRRWMYIFCILSTESI